MTGIVMEGWSPAPQGTHLPLLADGERHAMVSLVRTWMSDPGGVVLFLGTWPTLPASYKQLHAELSQSSRAKIPHPFLGVWTFSIAAYERR